MPGQSATLELFRYHEAPIRTHPRTIRHAGRRPGTRLDRILPLQDSEDRPPQPRSPVIDPELEMDALLGIRTTGRDESHADQDNNPYEPTP